VPDENYNRLISLIKDIEKLRKKQPFSSDFKAWKASVERHLTKTWPDNDSYLNQFNDITYSSGFAIASTGDTPQDILDRKVRNAEYFLSGLDDAFAMLQSFLGEVPKTQTTENEKVIKKEIGKNVFIVHGHDTDTLMDVKSTISTLGLNPIILHEQPSKNKTVIEKLEKHSEEADFAVILLTADDEGYPKGKESEKRFRARQNVVLELGLFQGLLGREKVVVLHQKDVEIPSDYAGVVYIPISGDWKLKLAKEMRAAGLDADSNKL